MSKKRTIQEYLRALGDLWEHRTHGYGIVIRAVYDHDGTVISILFEDSVLKEYLGGELIPIALTHSVSVINVGRHRLDRGTPWFTTLSKIEDRERYSDDRRLVARWWVMNFEKTEYNANDISHHMRRSLGARMQHEHRTLGRQSALDLIPPGWYEFTDQKIPSHLLIPTREMEMDGQVSRVLKPSGYLMNDSFRYMYNGQDDS